MKSRLSKPARTTASYSEEYKQAALQLWRASGRSAAKVAAELGIRAPLLYRWAQLEREPNLSKSESKPSRRPEWNYSGSTDTLANPRRCSRRGGKRAVDMLRD
jgi:transposase-like protein